jgi:hypothetical protein
VFFLASSLKGHILGILNVGVDTPNQDDIDIASALYEVGTSTTFIDVPT